MRAIVIDIDRRRPASLVLFVALCLAPVAGSATEVEATQPPFPDHLSFRLEDGHPGTSGLTLSFALPGGSAYECRQLAFRETRRGQEIRIELLGVAAAENKGFCQMAKEPPPIESRISLPTAPGKYQIAFVKEQRQDR